MLSEPTSAIIFVFFFKIKSPIVFDQKCILLTCIRCSDLAMKIAAMTFVRIALCMFFLSSFISKPCSSHLCISNECFCLDHWRCQYHLGWSPMFMFLSSERLPSITVLTLSFSASNIERVSALLILIHFKKWSRGEVSPGTKVLPVST